MNSSSNLTSVVIKDHTEMKHAYQQYLASKGNLSEREHWANYLQWGIARHVLAEELIVYPAFEKYLGAQGKKMADLDRAEHQEVKLMLHMLEASSPGDAHYPSTLEKLVLNLFEHIQGEEENDLPKLEEALQSDISSSLAQRFDQTKIFLPAKSPSDSEHKVPFPTLAHFLSASLERIEDILSQYSQSN